MAQNGPVLRSAHCERRAVANDPTDTLWGAGGSQLPIKERIPLRGAAASSHDTSFIAADKLHADDAPVPVLAPGAGRW